MIFHECFFLIKNGGSIPTIEQRESAKLISFISIFLVGMDNDFVFLSKGGGCGDMEQSDIQASILPVTDTQYPINTMK